MPICDSTHGEVVRADFDLDSVARQDSDIVHPHFSADVSEYFEVAFIELDAKSRVRQVFKDCAIQLNALLLSRLISRFLLKVPSSRHEITVYQGSAEVQFLLGP